MRNLRWKLLDSLQRDDHILPTESWLVDNWEGIAFACGRSEIFRVLGEWQNDFPTVPGLEFSKTLPNPA